ncbi:MAG: hypothetical protein ACI8ZX_001716 [Planctomycetota bacterium]|jgi:hypothetical protein
MVVAKGETLRTINFNFSKGNQKYLEYSSFGLGTFI